MKASLTVLLLIFSGIVNVSTAAEALSCNLGVLKDLGWKIEQTERIPGIENPHTCRNNASPVFTYNQTLETFDRILQRSSAALESITTRCLVNRQYKKSMQASIGKLILNDGFIFPDSAPDPRDPFIPPAQSWVAAKDRGYDIPAHSISKGINALYTEPFVAECATAAQIGQLALYAEHYGAFTDAMLQPRDIGIGVWPQYVKNPSIASKAHLLINTRNRSRALQMLSALGQGAFYGQTGYIKPYRTMDYIDSVDNRGQNFVIVGISNNAVEAIRQREKPLKELNRLSRKIWKKYKSRLDNGEDKKALSEELTMEFERLDPFFNEIKIYVHPLSIKNVAYHLGRQFKWNPRTPFVFEIYEDYQSGYFFKRYVDYRLQQCAHRAYCRKIDRKHSVLTDATGIPSTTIFSSLGQCESALTPSLFINR